MGCVMQVEGDAPVTDALTQGSTPGGLTFREYVESRGWRCGETTCEIESQAIPRPDVVFAPIQPAPDTRAAWLPEPPEGVGVVGAALQTNETTALTKPLVHVSEPDAVFYRPDGSGAHSMNVFANQFDAFGTNDEFGFLFHGCSTDYNNWCPRDTAIGQQKGSDPTAVFESSGTNFLHLFTLNSNGTGFSWYSRSGQVCPSGCSAQMWTECALGLPTGVTGADFPQALYLPSSDRKYLLYHGVFNGTNKIVIKRVSNGDTCSSVSNRVRQCAGSNSEFFARADYDAAGVLSVVYHDFTNPMNVRIRLTTYDTNTDTWSCNAPPDFGQFVPPAGTCAGQPAYTGVGTPGTLRQSANATVAIDSTSNPAPSINVAFVTGVGALEAQTQIWKKVNDVWIRKTQSGVNLYHPRLVFDKTSTSALAGRYHLIGLADQGTQLQAAQVRSTDGGSTWTDQLIGSAYTPNPVIASNCYWGDYEAIAPDRTNQGVFYGWTVNNGSVPAVIRGRIMNE